MSQQDAPKALAAWRRNMVLVGMSTLMLAACGDGGTGSPGGVLGGTDARQGTNTVAGVTTQYRATYQDGVVVVEKAQVDSAFRSVSPDGRTYRFDAGSSLAQTLKPGAVTVLAGRAIVKVGSVAHDGNDLVVVTEPAALTDAIKDADISWAGHLDFGAAPTAVNRSGRLGSGRAVPVDQPRPLEYEGTVNGWDTSAKIETVPGGLHAHVVAKVKAGDLDAGSIEGDILLTNVDDAGSLMISGGVVQKLTNQIRNAHVQSTLEWHAADNGEDFSATKQFEAPIKFPVPLYQYGVPITLSFKFTPFLQADMHGKSFSGGKYSLAYDTTEGFSIAKTADETATVSDPTADHGNVGSGGYVTVGMGAGMTEGVELDLGGLGQVVGKVFTQVYAYSIFDLPRGVLGPPACEVTGYEVKGTAGVVTSATLKNILGVLSPDLKNSLPDEKHVLFDKKHEYPGTNSQGPCTRAR